MSLFRITAYGTKIKDHFVSCKAQNLETSEIEELSSGRLQIQFKRISLKLAKGKYVIVEVTFKLTTQNHHIKTEYGAISRIKNLGIENPTIKRFLKRLLISDKKQTAQSCQIKRWKFLQKPKHSLEQFEKFKGKIF